MNGKRRWMVMVLALGGLWQVGCAGLNAYPNGMTKVLTTLAEKVADQGMVKGWEGGFIGRVDDPGMLVEACVTSRARLIGVSADLTLNAGGGGTGLAPGVRAELIAQLDGLSDEQRAAAMIVLWPDQGRHGDPVP